MNPILCICLNPTLQRTIVFSGWKRGEVNRARTGRLDASGKGVNTARIIHQYEDRRFDALHLTHAAGPEGGLFLRCCESDGLAVEAVEGGSVRTCTTLIDEDDGSVTELIEPSVPVDGEAAAELKRRFTALLPGSSAVVMSGSAAPGYPGELFSEFCREAAEMSVPVVADYRGKMLLESLPYRPAVVKINLMEFAATFGIPGAEDAGEQGDDRAIVEAAWPVLERLERDGIPVVLSRGSKETMYVSSGKRRLVPVSPLKAVNTIGCGDAFTAGLAIAVASGESIEQGIELGHSLAGRNALLLEPGVLLPKL
jgi:fructose-1-phosphate kinase PfkB-like protein